MFKKKMIRICAVIVACTICLGIIGSTVMGNKTATVGSTDSADLDVQTTHVETNDRINEFEESRAENLKFKIGELWRLSLNSDLDTSIKNAVQIINQNYDSEKLADAVKKTEEDFDVVANEYLASLQLEIKFELYVSDREAYEQEKDDINYGEELLTVEKIDEYLNELNAKEAEDIVNRTNNEQVNLPIISSPNVQPEVPNAKSVLPKNPADEIRKEIDGIASLSFN